MRRRPITLALLLVLGLWSNSGSAAESGEPSAAPSAPATPAAPGDPAAETPPPERESLLPEPPPAGVPSLQMSSDFAAPGLAIGGYRPTGQVSSTGIRVAPFTIRAGVHAGIGYDDNITLSRTNKKSSMISTLTPTIAIGLEGARHIYYAVYRGNYGVYSADAVNNYETHNFGLTAADDWSTRLRTTLAYDYLRGADARGATATAVDAPDTWQVQTLRGSASYGAPDAQGMIQGNAGWSGRRYISNRDLTAIRDYDQLDLGATFYYRVAPKTRVLTEIRRGQITHDRDPAADSEEMHYLVGVTWDATAKTRGGVRFGYMTKKFENSPALDISTPTYEADVSWAPTAYSSVNLSATRTFTEAIDTGSNFIVNNAGTVTWNHLWYAGILSAVAYGYSRQSQEGLGRTDTFQNFGVKASYPLRRLVRVGAEFRHEARGSTDPSIEYKRNLTLITIEAAL